MNCISDDVYLRKNMLKHACLNTNAHFDICSSKQ